MNTREFAHRSIQSSFMSPLQNDVDTDIHGKEKLLRASIKSLSQCARKRLRFHFRVRTLNCCEPSG